MGKPLQVAAAELRVKDLASKSIGKLEKGLQKSVKTLGKTETEAKQAGKQLDKLSRSFDKVRKSAGKMQAGKFGKGAARAGGAGFRGAAGGNIGSSFGALPVVGGVLAAVFGSIQATKTRFVQGISLNRDLLQLSSDYRTAFKKQSKKALKSAGKFFRKEDIQQSLTGLRNLGIGPKTIAGGTGKLAEFTKAQGFKTLQQGMQALTSGDIKAGRGISKIDIKRLQALAPLTKDVASAQVAFEQILEILKGTGKGLGKFSKITEKAVGRQQRTINVVTDIEQQTVRRGAFIKKGFKVFQAATQTQRLGQNVAAQVAGSSAPTASKALSQVQGVLSGKITATSAIGGAIKSGASGAVSAFKKFVTSRPGPTTSNQFLQSIGTSPAKKPKKKAGTKAKGGPVMSRQPVLVGEQGPELLIPRTSGNILTNTRTRQVAGGSSVTMNNTINIKVDGGSGSDVGNRIAREVQRSLDNLSRSSFRYNTGLAMRG